MKKYISFFIASILCTMSFMTPIFASAATPTIILSFVNEKSGVTNGLTKYEWVLNVNTTNIPNGDFVTVGVFINNVAYGSTVKVAINNNTGTFNTGFVLDPSITYQVIATYTSLQLGLANNTFTKTTTVALPATPPANNSNPVNNLPPQSGTPTPSSTYTLLAPIGDMTTAPSSIGDYFQKVFIIVIGLCAVLAVIMIVIGGIQYMGDESIFGKTEGKSKIKAAILGLLIALGAWALLNTINPDILGGRLKINAVVASIDETPILSDAGTPLPTNNTFIDCSGGVSAISTAGGTFNFCTAYATQLQGMMTAAYAANIKLGGGGFRTYAKQVALRIQNCPAPVTLTSPPSSSCHPETALPGTSNHEQGLAVDLTCNGALINFDNQNPSKTVTASTKTCFDWLVANAGTYGFKNLPKENWHWSTGPRAGH